MEAGINRQSAGLIKRSQIVLNITFIHLTDAFIENEAEASLDIKPNKAKFEQWGVHGSWRTPVLQLDVGLNMRTCHQLGC